MPKSKNDLSAEILIVFNPAAGSAHRAQIQGLIKRYFPERRLKLLESSDAENLPELIKPWIENGVNLIIAAGGDGTVSSLASAMVNTGVPLGILPLGTGNVLAREMEIPINVNQAAKLLAGPFDVRRLDAIGVGDKAYLLSVSVGISALTMRKTQPEAKRRYGQLAYLWTFLLNLIGLPQYEYEIELDGKSKKISASEIIALNSGILAYRLLRWGPDILPDDGRLDICFIQARSFPSFFRIVFGMFLRIKPEKNNIEVVIVKKKVLIKSPAGLSVQGDGDFIGTTPVEIRLIPAAIKIAVPAK
jgi:diacylglycerol kinase (ATP)